MGSTMTTGEGSMGANVASGIVWVTSKFFFSLSYFFFLKLNNVYSLYIIVMYKIHDGRGGSDKNETKQCQMRCLGHK